MAAIEVSVFAPPLQPIARRCCAHSPQEPVRRVSHSPPGRHTPHPSLTTTLRFSCVSITAPYFLPARILVAGVQRLPQSQKAELTAMRFPVYESLYFLNRNVQDILVILEEIKKSPGMPRRSFEAYQVDIQYLRSHATQDVLEVMNDTEIHEMAKLGKQKKANDDSIRDLDDVYFEVQQREEQRRKQGLPSLIGVLPRNYQPPASAFEEADGESETSGASQGVSSQDSIRSSARSPHGKKSAQNSRARRRRERAS